MKRFGLFGFLMVFAVTGSVVAQTPEFDLSLSGAIPCGGEMLRENGVGGGTVVADPVVLDCVLSVTAEEGVKGAQGWSISLASENIDITDITVAGTVGAPSDEGGLEDGGFEKTELTDNTGTDPEGQPGAGDCVGLRGAVSAIVLSFTEDLTLPADAPSTVAKITVQGGDFPAVDPALVEGDPPVTVGTSRIFFVNGCQGAGQPVNNNVTWTGTTVLPSLVECAIDLVVAPLPPECPSDASKLQVIAQSESVMEVTDLNAGMVDTPDREQPGEVVLEVSEAGGSGQVYYGIVSNGLEFGVQGWSLAIRKEGDATLDDVTITGTIAAPDPEGKEDGGFEKTEVIDPLKEIGDPPTPQNKEGVVSAIVFSFTENITLETTGTGTVLAITLGGQQGGTATLKGEDGLVGSGQPVNNVATVNGATEQFGCIQSVNVSFIAPSVKYALIGEPNNDGKINIADPIFLINNLFRGGPEPSCLAAADANGDGFTDLSDALCMIYYLFHVDLGGGTPTETIGTCVPFDPALCADDSAGCP